MAYSVEYDAVEKMIMAKIVGKTTQSELQEFGSRIIHMIKQENCFHILTDLREAAMNVSVVEMFNMPFKLREIAEAEQVSIYSAKRAVVALKTQKDLEFYETVSRNRGYYMQLFHDM